jgi:hypothetical protein
MFPFSGILIDGKSSYRWLVDNASKVEGVVSICSAFLRSSILEDLSWRFPQNVSVRIITRWKLSDLLDGASDLEAYDVCKKMGWEFYICTNFHGKVFAFPPFGILVGSANATSSGLGLLPNSNSEVCTVVNEIKSNKQLVENLFLSSKKMTDELYEKMKNFYHVAHQVKNIIDWPDFISNEIKPSIESEGKIFLSECLASNGEEILLFSKCNSAEAKSDASLLSLPSGQFNHREIANRFKETKIYLLLLQLLDNEGGQIYFGTLTEAIHSRLMEDPAPYRSSVIILNQNLYSWVSHLGKEYLGMQVDTPNRSQRIRLI